MDRAALLKQLGIHRRESARIERELGLGGRTTPTFSSAGADAVARLIADSSPDFLSVHGENGDYIFASRSVTKVLGYEPGELLGRNAYEYFHPDDIERISHDHAAHVNGDTQRVEYRIRRKDGSWHWVETDSLSTTDETGQRLIVAITRDVQERHGLQERLKWQNNQLQILHEVALRIEGNSDQELIDALRIMREALGMGAGMISEFRDNRVHTRLLEGPYLPVSIGESFPLEGSLSEYTANSIMVVAFETFAQNPVQESGIASSWPVKSYIGTRINVDGELYGTLAFGSRYERETPWTQTEKHLVHLAGKWIERAIELSRRRESLEKSTTRLHRLATRDALTGLLNRREVLTRLSAEVDRAQRYDTPFSLALLDLDHFKQINDTHGHKAGDNALRVVANTIKHTLRATDFCGRYGGEEFLVVWPNAKQDAAKQGSERLRHAIEGARFKIDGDSSKVTASIGLVEHRAGENVDELLARADKALYQAKAQGRNRVVAV